MLKNISLFIGVLFSVIDILSIVFLMYSIYEYDHYDQLSYHLKNLQCSYCKLFETDYIYKDYLIGYYWCCPYQHIDQNYYLSYCYFNTDCEKNCTHYELDKIKYECFAKVDELNSIFNNYEKENKNYIIICFVMFIISTLMVIIIIVLNIKISNHFVNNLPDAGYVKIDENCGR